MEKTNAKLEQIRRLFGARESPLSAHDQKKWWNDHIFKRGPGKPIALLDYLCNLTGDPKPMITGFFNFFSTGEYRKKNLILGEEDFVRFWRILADVDERHSRKIFYRCFPAPFTMASFMEDFIAFLSNAEFFDEVSNRVFNLLKFQGSCSCCSGQV
jgi:hypothetical protein